MIKKACLTAIIPLTLAFAEEVVIELKDPIATKHSIRTDEGGVLQTDKLRIQAKKIDYYKDENGDKIVEASGDLFIVYRRKFFLADSIVFNMAEQKGKLYNANGFAEGLFFGGQTIDLNPDGTLDADEAYATTSEKESSDWSVTSKKIHMNEKYQVKADDITVKVDKYPVIKGPAYSMGVNSRFKKPEARIKYRVLWERGQGPMVLTRLKAWDYEDLKIYLRGEYRIKRGGGGAMELDYNPDSKNQKLQLRNFYAYDTFYNDDNPDRMRSRYRLQGIYSGKNSSKNLEAFARWDLLSDKNMRSDFPTQLFELSTLERTEGFVKAYYDSAFTSVYGRPRVNRFRGFKQELPTLTVAFKPINLANTNIILNNYVKASYLEYSYASNLEHLVSNFQSGRIETKQALHRSFELGPLSVVPNASVRGLFYSNTPENKALMHAIGQYGIDSSATFEKNYTTTKHSLTPYANFTGIATPATNVGDVYIFSIQDGYNTINQLKLGLKNQFFTLAQFSPKPLFETDVYAYNFFDTQTFSTPFPKVGVTTSTNFSKMSIDSFLGYNMQMRDFDFANLKVGCTINDYFAFTAEVRHRGKYYWRKNDYDNYVLDVTRSINSLENTPLSDYRTTFRSKWQLQLSPLWTIRVLNHVGWRPNKPFYHESKVEMQTFISNAWRFRLGYTRTVRTNQFTMSLNLI